MQIFWTRRQEMWEEDRKLFQKSQVLSLPLIHCVPISQTLPNYTGSLLVTSKLAAEYLSQVKPEWVKKYSGKIITFSEAVAKVLHPYQPNLISASTVEELLHRQQDSWIDGGESIIFAGAESSAFPVVEYLSGLGIVAYKIDLYQTLPTTELSDTDLKALRAGGLICFASPSAVDSFHALSKKYALKDIYKFACIGPSTSKRCEQKLGQGYTSQKSDLNSFVRFVETLL